MPRPGRLKGPNDHALAQQLDLLRREEGLSTAELASVLHCSDRTIRRYQSGERRPDRDLAAQWARACSADPAPILALYDAGENPGGLAAAERARAGEPPPPAPERRPRRRLPRWLAVPVGAIAVLAAGALWLSGGDDPSAASVQPVQLIVDNRVTNGPTTMDDDPSLVTLTSQARPYCRRYHCEIGATARRTGQAYDGAVCQLRGTTITNGNQGSPDDDANPGLATSDRYYGVRLRDGRFGYVSEVWIRKSQRGGLGLPACRAKPSEAG